MNLPNKFSLLRIIMVPVMAAVYLIPVWYAPIISVALFTLAAFTDFLDGHIARKYDMVTDLGKLLDPIADKMLICFALFLVVEKNILPIGVGSFCGAIIICRELLISVVRQIAAGKGVIIQANKYGKFKTIFQDISLPVLMLLAIPMEGALKTVMSWTGYVLFGAAVLLTIISCVVYLVQNKGVFVDSAKTTEKK